MTPTRAGILALFLSGASLPSTYAQTQSVPEILGILYDGTSGYYWNDSNGWFTNDPYCSWSGVQCHDVDYYDERYGQIEALDLSSNNLQGELPQEIWSIPFLSRLILRENPDLTVRFDESRKAEYLNQLVLSNTYIETFEYLVGEQLQELHLTGCSLSMLFPYEVTQLKNLQALYANFNNFYGYIPDKISDMERLVELYLFSNNLEGNIPESITLMEDLEIIALSGNNLSGSLPGPQMNNLQSLRILALADNSLEGNIPSFDGLFGLRELYLQNNDFTGEIPDDFLWNAPKNEEFTVDLSNNSLSGVFGARRMADFYRLTLGLTGNEFTGIDDELCAMDEWMSGAVAYYNCDAILCPIGSWAPEGRSTNSFECEEDCETATFMGSTTCDGDNMRILSDVYEAMNGDKWSDNNWFYSDDECEWTGITCYYGDGGQKFINRVELSDMKLSGTVPSSLFTLVGLEYLDLSNNFISFQFDGIENAKSLQVLDITSTGLDSFDYIEQLAGTSITELYMSNNNVNERIPDSIYDLTGLTILNIAHNKLNENISWRIGQLDQLEKLSLYGNKLTGKLPKEFVSTPLEELTLSENDFTGAIPDAFSNMPSLKVLSLHQKTNTQGGFTGEVPDFKGSVNLQLLNLASNSLSSYLPETFMEDSELKGEKITVDLSHNTIRGKIPLSWDMFGYLNINLSDNFIDDMPEKLCSMQGWQDGVLGAMDGCNPILCEKGSFNAYGRATPGNECVPCPGSEFYGATTCLSLGSSEIWWTLETFYASTNGDEWSGGDGWLSSPNPCDGTWAGITCDNDNIDIIEIDLSESGLTGTPDPIIFTLPRLEVLKLAFNDIDFTFDGIENAKYLRSLHLSGTRVSSLEGVGKAKPLTQLHLTSSYLFGQIPDELYDLTNLRGLFMNYNKLTGRISPKIGQLQNLEELFLLKNDLTGQIPATIGNLQKMKNLSLSQNYLVGSIPESINKMKDLEILALQGEGSDISDIDRRKLKLQTRRTQAYSGLTGTLPSLNGLKKVKEVYLGFNSISGKIPYNFLAGVEDKTKEITIELESNSLSGVVPASLTQFDSLNLYIGANKFNGIASGLCSMNNWFAGDVGTFKCDAIMCPKDTFSQWGRRDEDAVCEQCPDGTVTPYMGSFECVSAEEQAIEDEKTVLKLMYDSLDGIGWHSQGNWYDDSVSFCDWHGITCTSGLQSIQAIHLGENGLKGILPNSVFDLPNLMELNLARNVITINFDYIGSASKLEYLNLDSTGQTNLSGINSAPSLTLLHASNNDFAQFPPELLTMTNLKVLYLSTNKFDSKIPDLSGLNQLAFFACKKCAFTGKLPSWLGNLANLQYLSLASNKLTGEIPTGLTEMNSLTHLDLSDQAPRGGGITGSIPSFSNSENISELYLHRNKLSGSISDDFLAMTTSSTVTVDLRWNSISGSVPQTLKDRGFEEFILLLAENKIDNIPTSICSLEGWNQGDLLTFQCEGLLCENGYYSPIGRATDGYECVECPATEDVDTQTYYGSTTCGTSDEMNALEKMYYALGGPDWTNNYSWLENDIYCTWYGIDCDEDEQIIGLDLSWNNLVGEVPREMFDLVTLTYLSLKNNAITVNFDGIEKLSSLETLNLSEVGLTSIAGIGAASSLVELHLTNNELTSIPDDLYSLTKLESLLMNYNKVEGSLSPKIGQLAAIREIFMYRNKLSGNLPTEIGNLNNVEILSLGENNFSGELPEGINDLQKLRVIALQHSSNNGAELGKPVVGSSGRGLSGSVPAFDNNPNLREVYLSSNSLSGGIPNSFLRNVEDKNDEIVIDLAGNTITGSVPSILNQFPQLDIYLAGNQISELDESVCENWGWMNGGVESNGCDSILCPIGYYNEFGRQTNDGNYCEVCPFTFTAPYLGSTTCAPDSKDYNEREILTKLYKATGGSKWFNADNWLEDNVSICEWHGIFCEAQSLSQTGAKAVTEIHLPSNKMKGTIPPQIFNLQSLRMLNVRDNKVDVELFAMRESPALRELYLDYTHVSSLKGIGRATNLRTLHVQENNFSGESFPDELFDLADLRHVYASGSNIGGELSPKIANLQQLEEFYAHGNDLSGEIPYSIGNLEKLEVLVLSENLFVGPLPESILNLSALQSLFIDSLTRRSAGLSGPLPSFDGMPNLRQIYLNENSLTGTIPENFLGDDGVLYFDELSEDGLAALGRRKQKINVGLRGNRIEGSIPSFLSKFEKLNIDLSDNFITSIDDELCEMGAWMGNDVGSFYCNAILCPAGTYNQYGRQTNVRATCERCDGAEASEFFGATKCMAEIKKQEREILQLFYNDCGGDRWKHNDNWMNDKIDICNWYGIECSNGGTVESIALGSNNVVGIPPREIFQLDNLKYFWLYSNPVKFSFEGIVQARRLQSLLLDSTGLESLKGIGQAYNLVDLDLRFNKLKGPITDEISNLVNLESLTLSDNELTGELPSFVRMHSLKSLRLSSNDLTGALPTFASNDHLKYIDLSDNRISGTIAPSFLDSLEIYENIYIDLSRNRIEGKVPRELARFEDVTIFLKDNYVFGIERDVCENDEWNDGDVGEFGCDAILCAPGTFAPGKGRQAVGGSECQECRDAKYFGQSQCIDLQEFYSSAVTKGIGMATILVMTSVTMLLL